MHGLEKIIISKGDIYNVGNKNGCSSLKLNTGIRNRMNRFLFPIPQK